MHQLGIDVPQKTIQLLLDHQHTLAVSEGACGGLLSAALVAHEGASKFFDGSRLIYSLKSRLRLSGWKKDQIDDYTGPSVNSVTKLARTLRMEFGSPWVLCETGYAGPHDENTGQVFLAIINPNGETITKSIDTKVKDRVKNMHIFAQDAIDFLSETMESYYS